MKFEAAPASGSAAPPDLQQSIAMEMLAIEHDIVPEPVVPEPVVPEPVVPEDAARRGFFARLWQKMRGK